MKDLTISVTYVTILLVKGINRITFFDWMVVVSMTGEQVKLLAKMKKLINKGCKKFACRRDRDYIQELLDIGISESVAWQEILTLSSNNYYPDHKLFSADEDALIFKKYINSHIVYIKIKIEQYNNNEMVVCLSFHIDHK